MCGIKPPLMSYGEEQMYMTLYERVSAMKIKMMMGAQPPEQNQNVNLGDPNGVVS